MWQTKTLFLMLMTVALCSCQKTNSLMGYRTTADQPWEEVNFADTISDIDFKVIIDFGFGLGSFHVQSAQPAQSVETASVLLDMEGGTYDEPDGDLDMRYFNLAPDRKQQIPHIQEIIQENPSLTVGVLADKYPNWMKLTHAQEDLFQEAYGLYLSKYIELYKKENANIQKVVLPLNNPWGKATQARLTENFKKQDIELLTTDSLALEEDSEEQPMTVIWENVRKVLDAGLPLASVILERDNTEKQLYWKKQFLKHLLPLQGHPSTYLKSTENPKVLAFQLPPDQYFLLFWNPEKKGGILSLYLKDREWKIPLAAQSLNSILLQ